MTSAPAPETLVAPHERFAYAPIVDRRPVVWPNGARLAVWVVPNIEHYEYVPEHVRVRNPWSRSPAPDVLGYGIRDYGNRVGVWRLMETFDRLGIRCTVSLSLAVLERYPEIFRAMEERRWEYMSHGWLNTRYHWNLSEDDERAEIARCAELHQRLTGRRMAGWFSPAASFTLATPDLVAEAGFKYYCDFYHDDQPCPVDVRSGRLVTLPYSMEVNDSIAWARGMEGAAFETMVRDAFDTLYAESGRVMCVAVHPFIMGQPHRIRHLERALAYVLGHPGVWCATGEEIVDAWLAQQEPAT